MQHHRRQRITHRIRQAVLDDWGPENKRRLLNTVKDMMHGIQDPEDPDYPNVDYPETVLELFQDPKIRQRVLKLVPPGAKYYHYGLDTLIFLDPDGQHVYKYTLFPQDRDRSKDPPNLLQPIWVQPVSRSSWLTKYKKARTLRDKDLTPEERRRINEFGGDETIPPGWQRPPMDWGPHQVGLVDDELKVLDEGSVPKNWDKQETPEEREAQERNRRKLQERLKEIESQ
jgi:hypothetical protein